MNTKPTALERFTGNTLTEAVATFVAEVATPVTPFAALLPVLTNSLAGQRQQKRIETTFLQMSLLLQTHEQELQRLSDEQYHLLIAAISTTFQTINPEKLAYLQSAIRNSLSIESLVSQESAVLARVIRDISAEEADFVIKNFSYKFIHVSDLPSDQRNVLTIPRRSRDSLIVTGLESLGILEFGVGTMGDGNMLCFSNFTSKLIALLSPRANA